MLTRRARAVAVFAWRTNARSRLTRIGCAGGLAILFCGPGISAATGRGWTFEADLAFFGLLVAMIFGLRSGIEQQREHDLDRFLTHNFVSRAEYAMGMVASLLAAWATICAGAFVAFLVASGGDLASSGWHVASWGLRAAIVAAFVPLVERFMPLRTPFVLPALAYFLLAVALSMVLGETRALELMVVTSRQDPATLVPLGAHAALALTLGTGTFLVLNRPAPLAWWTRKRPAGAEPEGLP